MTNENKIISINGVKFHRHPNGGGLVAETTCVHPTAHVGPNARVFGHAILRENTKVLDNAMVCGRAIIHANTKVIGFARVFGFAVLENDVIVGGRAKISDHARITAHSSFDGNADQDWEVERSNGNCEDWTTERRWWNEEALELCRLTFHIHPNGGGLVAETANVHPDAYIEEGAMIFGYAKIDSEARLREGTRVFGDKVILPDPPTRPTYRTRKPSRKSARKMARKEARRRKWNPLDF